MEIFKINYFYSFKVMNNIEDLKDNCFFLNMKHLNDELLVQKLVDISEKLSAVTYAEYVKNVKSNAHWDRKKKMTADYPNLYYHCEKDSGIDFMIGMSDYKLVPDLNKHFSKFGYICYSQEIMDNKCLRKQLFRTLMGKINQKVDDEHLIFMEVPVKDLKWKGYIMNYGNFCPCTDINIVKKIIDVFNITIKSEPKLVETELLDKKIKELPYETYYVPHSIYLVKKSLKT
ncbi:hypothetical protein COS64_03065 [archaeon CG06_land_8_20_14_3_00_37_11]|nr:MAG: hypothetical protein COS64_03065 [archaeon CG06_land_8_20_14_3_00_37_11]